MEHLISEEMKTDTMKKREKRIERIKRDIEKAQQQLSEQEELLKEDQMRAVERSISHLNKALSVGDRHATLDDIISFIDFVNNDKDLTLEETKVLIDKMRPNRENNEPQHTQPDY